MTSSSNPVIGALALRCCAFHNAEPLTDAQKHRIVGRLPLMRMRITCRSIFGPDAMVEPYQPPDRCATHAGFNGWTAVTGGRMRAPTLTERR